MRGADKSTRNLFSYVDIEELIPSNHPLRFMLAIVNDILDGMSAEFEAMYSSTGRPSIPPEMLVRALLLQMLYSIRSERQLMEQIKFNSLYRWFIGLEMDDRVWDASTFAKNRDRFLDSGIADQILARMVGIDKVNAVLGGDHFSVDGTLFDALASIRSYVARDGGEEDADDGDGNGGDKPSDFRSGNFKGKRISNDTHVSATDPDALLKSKNRGVKPKPSFTGNVVMDNESQMVVAAKVNLATGTAEREAAEELVEEPYFKTRTGRQRRITLGADKGYDAAEHITTMRKKGVTPHTAANDFVTKTGKRRKTLIDGRTTRHDSYKRSQKDRKKVEKAFGWLKDIAGQRRTRFKGMARVHASFVLGVAAYNLTRMYKLMGAPPCAA